MSQTISQNQPKITEDQPEQKQNYQPKDQDKAKISLQQIRKRHPQCIPIYFVKHQKCPKDFPAPTIPFMLFSKQLKIEQAMYNLYKQIDVKGLYFFCHYVNEKAKRIKYVQIQPGQTIQQVYKKYGKNNVLNLIYGDKNIGMEGVNKVQKWLIRILVVLLVIWGLLTIYPYFLYYSGLADNYNIAEYETSMIGQNINQDMELQSHKYSEAEMTSEDMQNSKINNQSFTQL